eukprot:NODE_2970_length_1003_cov_4.023061_g2483_i0.p1 GENE.NODE_2970_length_1003_cov_4.023061_g2483_i0~~NODE_2970_length_1003_cov_4.023061_g2483_i0.p1  ORF type:complete len:179 (+),score=53.11 NODE_2970_length_1003_cov_4.023061_g2483_i0:3-539(+)
MGIPPPRTDNKYFREDEWMVPNCKDSRISYSFLNQRASIWEKVLPTQKDQPYPADYFHRGYAGVIAWIVLSMIFGISNWIIYHYAQRFEMRECELGIRKCPHWQHKTWHDVSDKWDGAQWIEYTAEGRERHRKRREEDREALLQRQAPYIRFAGGLNPTATGPGGTHEEPRSDAGASH